MTTKTKKTVAKEIILFFSILLLALLFFCGNLFYNFLLSRSLTKQNNQSKLISKSIDSLKTEKQNCLTITVFIISLELIT